MLPSKGQCEGTFLLCRAAVLGNYKTTAQWINAARNSATQMAHALDLNQIANDMMACGLASVSETVSVSEALQPLWRELDRSTLLTVARLLIKARLPFWIHMAVKDDEVRREYIPEKDLQDLIWLEPQLDQFLIDIYEPIAKRKNEDFQKQMGDAAELLLMAALEAAGRQPIHTAKISDAIGYDIECQAPVKDRIEVKAATANTQTQFHLTRNEFEKSTIYQDSWRIIQVIFAGSVFTTTRIGAEHVAEIRELRPTWLQENVPGDTPSFKWTESALLTPKEEDWRTAELELAQDSAVPGFI
ncbi:protein NO VEIN domain-containing protein [Asticcacaulis sp.]|uniref:protein NO VEIN domain-containing protein n=1 Tax=Asticcacaulis sp. TaxID=1872648 RepID=UPI003F7C30AF